MSLTGKDLDEVLRHDFKLTHFHPRTGATSSVDFSAHSTQKSDESVAQADQSRIWSVGFSIEKSAEGEDIVRKRHENGIASTKTDVALDSEIKVKHDLGGLDYT